MAPPPTQPQHAPAPLYLDRAMTLWENGKWSNLTAQQAELVAPDGDRGLIAAYVAAAHHFVEDHEAARDWAYRALEWDCPKDYLLKVLSASYHITLARMAAIAGDLDRARRHRSLATNPTSDGLSQARTDARLSRDLTQLGFLDTATDIIGDDLQHAIEQPLGRVARHRINILKSELIQIRQQLAMFHKQRNANHSGDSAALAEKEQATQQSTSQLGQDLWVLERTGYKHDGFFVEFGATDGILLSNTYMLETVFGWNGVLAEPNPEYFEELKKNRTSQCSDACITGNTGDTVQFVLADEFGGIKDFIARDRHAERRAPYAALEDRTISVKTISLDDFLTRHGAPHKIDYISVDTEGNELEILRAFPFDKWDISMWTVEHNFTEERDAIFELMTAHGYQRKEVRFDDWYYKTSADE